MRRTYSLALLGCILAVPLSYLTLSSFQATTSPAVEEPTVTQVVVEESPTVELQERSEAPDHETVPLAEEDIMDEGHTSQEGMKLTHDKEEDPIEEEVLHKGEDEVPNPSVQEDVKDTWWTPKKIVAALIGVVAGVLLAGVVIRHVVTVDSQELTWKSAILGGLLGGILANAIAPLGGLGVVEGCVWTAGVACSIGLVVAGIRLPLQSTT